MKNSPSIPYSLRAGFTLLEMAIALLVIGLLTAGIFVGDSMLRTARIQGTIAEFTQLSGAFKQFKEKYNALPGDMIDATNFWAGGAVTCLYGASTGVATCNGNGNGQIADQTNYSGAVAGNRTESHRAWQQLGFAGLIPGSYEGAFENAATVLVTPGTRVPKTALKSGAGWHVYFVGPQSASSTFFDGNYGHIFYLGAGVYQTTANSKGVLTTEEMTSLDTKYDDGKPAYGKIRQGKYNSGTGYFGSGTTAATTCVASDTATSAVYTTNTGVTTCVPIFITGF